MIAPQDTTDLNGPALTFWEVRWRAGLLAGLGLLTIVLSAIALSGVVADSVSQRTREICVRMTPGARRSNVHWLLLEQGLRIAGLGILIGLGIGPAAVRLLRSFLYGLSPFDPVACGAAALLWVAIALLASWYPARRAMRVDPVAALNYE